MDDDEETIDYIDFTVVTDVERFIVALEAVLHEWQLTAGSKYQKKPIRKGALQRCNWKTCNEIVRFDAIHSFQIAHHWPIDPIELSVSQSPINETDQQMVPIEPDRNLAHISPWALELIDANSDFTAANPITAQFGLSEYLLLTPAIKDDGVVWNSSDIDESQRNVILSALNIASVSTECELPILFQYGDPTRQLFAGVCQNRNIRTTFDSVHLRRCQPQHAHLAGLLDLFREKVNCLIATPPAIKISVMIDYILQERLDAQWTQSPPDFDADQYDDPDDILVGPNSHLPFGAVQDPLKEFRLSVTWPNLNEDMIVENAVYTDLDPMNAPYWAASVSFETGLKCLMHDSIRLFLDLSRNETRCTRLLGIIEHDSIDGINASTPLNRLTQSSPMRSLMAPNLSITNPRGISTYTDASNLDLPLDQMAVSRWIRAIFATNNGDRVDDDDESIVSSAMLSTEFHESQRPGTAVKDDTKATTIADDFIATSSSGDAKSDNDMTNYRDILRMAKSANNTSITSRIAVSLCHLLSSNGNNGLVSMCQLWYEVVMKLRVYWEKCNSLPGDSAPDLGSCLLHQKLMMLQCCIDAKRRRHKLVESTTTNYTVDNDEYFDANEDIDDNDDDDDESIKTVEMSDVDNVDRPPIGRLHPFENVKLLNRIDDAVYVPITQNRSPMTEDMIDEQAEYLSSFGESAEGGQLRLKAQCDALLSDMQAFKAANPGCSIGDFVRWHSPRDWIETAPNTGHLSERMATPGNTWLETWTSARAIPVASQNRLFNESKEAEKILYWLGNLKLCELVELLRPILMTNGGYQLIDEAIEVRSLIADKLDAVCRKIVICTRHNKLDDYLDTMRDIHWVEMTAVQYRALKSRLSINNDNRNQTEQFDVHMFILALMRQSNPQPPVPIFGASNGHIGIAVRQLLKSDCRLSTHISSTIPPIARRQYILRWMIPRPSINCRRSPQRLYASIDALGHFRLYGAFSDDITFF